MSNIQQTEMSSTDMEALESATYTGAIYDCLIRPGMHAAVIGPNTSPVSDPVGLQLAWNCGETGKVLCIDPQGWSSTHVVEHVMGIGNAISYKESIDLLRHVGMKLAPFELLGERSSLVDIPSSVKNLDCIAEKGTIHFIGSSQDVPSEYFLRGYYAISNALRPGGIFISHIPDTWFEERFRQTPEETLAAFDLKVLKKISVREDVFRFRVGSEVLNSLKQISDERYSSMQILAKYLHDRGKVWAVDGNSLVYYSESAGKRVIIAQKKI